MDAGCLSGNYLHNPDWLPLDFNYARSAGFPWVYQYLLSRFPLRELEKVISSAIERVEENMAVSAKTPNEKDSEMSDPIRQGQRLFGGAL